MNNKSDRPGSRSIHGPLFAVFSIVLMALTAWLFTQRTWWFPKLASVHGADVDRVFYITLGITSVLFLVLQGYLAYVTFKFGDRHDATITHWISPGMEKRFAIIAGIIILGVDATLFSLGDENWFKKWEPAPAGTAIVEVTGEQFMWTFRYPGPDGQFGKTSPELVSATNPLGLDMKDPSAKDDIVSLNQLHLPVGKPVRLRLRSKDVIHSFFLPYHRMRQDVMPGMQIEIWLTPDVAGQFEIACTQLCGLGHYRMRAYLTVESPEAVEKWQHELTQ